MESVYKTCLAFELTANGLLVAQLVTYLKLTGCPVGLLMNFNVPLLRSGIRRVEHPSIYDKRR